MRIALASSPVLVKDREHNVSAMLHAMEQCREKADMIVFGETALQGFECLTWDYEVDRHMAVSQNDPMFETIREAARQSRMAVSFGYVEGVGDALFSSQMVIDDRGATLHNYRRVSVGWKEYWHTDAHYREGERFETFSYKGKRFSIALCGDLWTDGRPSEMRSLNADIVLWPVWCDFAAREWNENEKYEYARQAALSGDHVLYVNPFCADPKATDAASGGCVYFKAGRIAAEVPAGKSDVLIVEI